jgi:hypothetical protein
VLVSSLVGVMVSEGQWIDRIFFIMLFAVGVFATAYLIFGSVRPPTEDTTRSAHRWADSLGMRVTGIVCEHHRCTVAPEHGEPFTIYCGVDRCSLPERAER